MKTAQVSSAALLALLIGSQWSQAEGWPLPRLGSLGKQEETKRSGGYWSSWNERRRRTEPSAWAKINADARRLFAGVKDALTRKKPAPKRRPTNQYVPWIRQPGDARHRQDPRKQKESWWDSLFGRHQPKRAKTISPQESKK